MTPSNQNRASDPLVRLSDDAGAPHASDDDGAAQASDVGASPRPEPRFGHVDAPPARERTTPTPCGHTRHVGTCPTCQRAQLARWRAQLAHANDAAPACRKETCGKETRR